MEGESNNIQQNEEEDNEMESIIKPELPKTKTYSNYSDSNVGYFDVSTKSESNEEKNKEKDKLKEKDIDIDIISDLKDKFKEILAKITLKTGKDNLVYGMSVYLLKDKKKIVRGILYCNDETYLTFIKPNSKADLPKFKILLSSISDMSIGIKDGDFGSLKLPLKSECCLTVNYSNNFSHFNFMFSTSNDLEIFICGIISLLQKRVNDNNNCNTDLLILKRIWKEYDPEHSKSLNLNQFSDFLKNINFDFKNKTPEMIFNEKGKDGRITFKQFIYFYEELVTGEEFREVFEKYSYTDKKNFISVKGIIDFMQREQSESLTQEQAIEIVYRYKKNKKELPPQKQMMLNINEAKVPAKENSTDKKFLESESMLLEYVNHSFGKGNSISNNLIVQNQIFSAYRLSFREFVNFIIDKQKNNIFEESTFKCHQDMNQPLTDYYCNSSHNTYLSGNQVTGESSSEMYKYVLKNGCRFVDLDTYDGPENEPIITHWHFPVGGIDFKETLEAIKEVAFLKSEYPVILSLENHCSASYQERMNYHFLKVLGKENLYIIDQENPPLIYPSPNELKRKYIIKNKRKRIFGNFNINNINNINNISNVPNKSSPQNISNNNNNNNISECSNYTTQKNSIYENENNNNNNTFISTSSNNENNNFISTSSNNENNNFISTSSNKENNNIKIDSKKERILEKLASHTIISEEDGISSEDEYSYDSGIEENISLEIYDYPPLITSSKILACNKYNISYTPCHNISFEYEGIPNESYFINHPNSFHKSSKKSENFEKKAQKFANDSEKMIKNIVKNETVNKLKDLKIKNEDVNPNSNESNEKRIKAMNRVKEIKDYDDKYNPMIHIKIITEDCLANILGMVGVKYHKETFNPTKFLPWECLSIAEPDILKYITNFNGKHKIIEYCQKSFLKIYPDTIRFNSSNYCPVYFWSLGTQFAALNLQKRDDDSVIINKMLFKTNGGSKCGYVLKPKILRDFVPENYTKFSYKFSYKIRFKILSGFHLNLCCPKKEKILGMYIEVSFKGPSKTDFVDSTSQDKKIVTNIINNNFLHPVWMSNSVIFDVYEPELSFIIVKLFAKKKMKLLAKAAIPVSNISYGYRVLELYDNECSKFDESYLIVRTTKITK